MADNFDGQIDYLEQFGSSSVSLRFTHIKHLQLLTLSVCDLNSGFYQFKESALRKQSLYLKFDPLLRESPRKSAGPAAHTSVPRPASLVSRYSTFLFARHFFFLLL